MTPSSTCHIEKRWQRILGKVSLQSWLSTYNSPNCVYEKTSGRGDPRINLENRRKYILVLTHLCTDIIFSIILYIHTHVNVYLKHICKQCHSAIVTLVFKRVFYLFFSESCSDILYFAIFLR